MADNSMAGTGRVNILVALLATHPDGLTRAELLTALRKRWPGIGVRQIDRLLEKAAPLVEATGGMVRAAGAAPAFQPDSPGGVRVVAIDLETMVKETATPPYRDLRIWQIGAVRFGVDGNRERFDEMVTLPEGWDLYTPELSAEQAARARPPRAALESLARFCEGAEYLVAYNGVVHDFAILDDIYANQELPPLGSGRRVDGLYLAYLLHPQAPGHSLRPLCESAGVNIEGLRWHDAADDAEMLARLAEQCAAELFSGWPAAVRDLVLSATAGSDAIDMLCRLAGRPRGARPYDDGEVEDVIHGAISGRPQMRPATPRTRLALSVPDALRTRAGAVDPYALATEVAKDRILERRPAQDDMARIVAGWVDQRQDGMVEAPTGTGKSLAALAVALGWLERDNSHRVIIATHTKQLQGQLAHDLETLSGVPGLGWLARESDLVKGRGNLLSIRALVAGLADCTVVAPESSGSPAARVGFRELAAYLLVRLLSQPVGMVRRWEARSVDVVDLPGFFEAYLPAGHHRFFARYLSQEAGEYAVGAHPITRHTALAKERLGDHRLVIGNHALLLANREDLPDPSKTLLMVDEAHLLEGTATEALSASADYGELESFHAELEALTRRHAGAHDTIAKMSSIADEMRQRLVSESLPKAAQNAFDLIAGRHDRFLRPRLATLASPFGGDEARSAVRHIQSQCSYHRVAIENATRMLFAFQAQAGPGLTRNARERLAQLIDRAVALRDGLQGVTAAIQEIFGARPPQLDQSRLPGEPSTEAAPPVPVPDGNGGTASASSAGGAPASDGGGKEHDDDEDLGETDGAGEADPEESCGDGGAPSEQWSPPPALAPVPLSNLVVWAQESARSAAGPSARNYRFSICASPIELRRSADWQLFRGLFATTVFMSATLRVAGHWHFIRSRLGLGENVAAVALPTPFSMRDQAMLVAFGDFPSWSEHETQAVKTIAHQLSGYVREVPRRPEPGAAVEHGAMVITTSTSAAARIHELVQRAIASTGIPARSTVLDGNQRAVHEYLADGGVLVGTKGLWAGVDIHDASRTRLLWINKLPFAPFADPLVTARRAAVLRTAELAGAEDPEAVATEEYYLPLAAIELRQGVGRLIRSRAHRGAIIISDRKLAGSAPIRRRYREIFLGSLDEGLHVPDTQTGETCGGNVVTMTNGWRQIWEFLGRDGSLAPQTVAELCTDDALERHTLLADMQRISALRITRDELVVLGARGDDVLADEVAERCQEVARLLADDPDLVLRDEQVEVIRSVATGHDTLALLPTAFGKSFCFQLPAMVMPGATLVISPLVALMADQAYDLNGVIGGAVRALVHPMRESCSRTGKMEVAQQLSGEHDHGIRIVYMSPERLAHRQVRDWIRKGAACGALGRIAIDEAHTLAQWGDDFRPSFRRAAVLLDELRRDPVTRVPVTALTATANPTVRETLRQRVFGLDPGDDRGDPASFRLVSADPIRPELPVYRRQLGATAGGTIGTATVVEAVASALEDHAIFYCLTVREVEALHAHLRDFLGEENAHRVRRFHGRLGEAEKVAVLEDFKSAPRHGEDGFSPMIVVATSAFGLGVNRPDIRCVFATSPATDLSALYQQLGRAGRDQRNIAADDPRRVPSPGIALATQRGFRTVEFLTGQDHSSALLRRMAVTIMASRGWIDADGLARTLVDEDDRLGKLSETDRNRRATVIDRYRTGVVWCVAALSSLGVVADRGDFPATVRIRRGEVDPPEEDRALVTAALAAGGGNIGVVEIARALEIEDCAEAWSDMLELYHAGILDVSQAPNRQWLTSVEVLQHNLPETWHNEVRRRREGGARELGRMRAWFSSESCANRDRPRPVNWCMSDPLHPDVGHGQAAASKAAGASVCGADIALVLSNESRVM